MTMKNENDKILLRDLRLNCLVGVPSRERSKRQEIFINVILFCVFSRAVKTDDVKDTIDYDSLSQDIQNTIENREYCLLERLAEDVAQICLKDKRVRKAQVTVDKPGALKASKSAAVEIIRVSER